VPSWLMRKKKRENARQEQDGAKQCKMSNTSDRNMQNVYALAEARKKKADLDRLKHKMKDNEEETDYNDICGSYSSVNTNDHVVVEDVFSDDEDSSVHRFVDNGCVSNRTEIDRCHSPVFGEEELNQCSERQSAYGFDGQAVGS
jgi:hypothetical protein